MVTFVPGPVALSVPATSANLGPGFDALGVALDLRDRLEGEVTDGGLEVEISGEGADAVPRDESHLVVRSMRAAFDAMGAEPPGLRLHCRNAIPHARGLGSSSAAIVGGVSLARALVAGGSLLMDDAALFVLAARIEGHPDNVAPALYGGFVISGQDGGADDPADDDFFAVRSDVDPRISVVVLIPDDEVSTEAARGLLPGEVPHADAARNAGRAALLVAALAGKPEHLWRATGDLLHQEQRRPAMPQSMALVDELRADGVAAVISGAGPTVLAFTNGSSAPSTAAVLNRCPDGWSARHLNLDMAGVRLT